MLTQDYLTLKLVRVRSPANWVLEGHGLYFLFPKAGAGRYVSGRVTEQISPGGVLVLSAAQGGKVGALDGGEVAFQSFCVCFEHLIPLFETREICLLQGVTERFKGARSYPATSALAKECHRVLLDLPPQFSLEHRAQLLQVVAAVLAAEFKDAQAHRVGYVDAEEHITQVFDQLSAAEILHLSVDELAGKFGCSRRHLNRLFHQHFGISVAALKMEMRLLKAMSLLQDPHAKVIHVAEECGFNHLGLFNTCFKRRFGASPGQWRKSPGRVETAPAVPLNGAEACRMRINGLCPWADRRRPASQPSRPTPGVLPALAVAVR